MTSRGESSSPRPTQDRKKSSFTETLKAQFRQLAKSVTRRIVPPRRRSRTEETRGGFRLAVKKVMRRIQRPETPPPDAEPVWLADTMHWLQLWSEHEEIAPDVLDDPARPCHDQQPEPFSAAL